MDNGKILWGKRTDIDTSMPLRGKTLLVIVPVFVKESVVGDEKQNYFTITENRKRLFDMIYKPLESLLKICYNGYTVRKDITCISIFAPTCEGGYAVNLFVYMTENQ